jgi:hypothetical protein
VDSGGGVTKLTQLGYNMVPEDLYEAHQITGAKKTDKVDSRILADLLRTDTSPEVYILSSNVLGLRDLARHRKRLVNMLIVFFYISIFFFDVREINLRKIGIYLFRYNKDCMISQVLLKRKVYIG